jgi:ABC-type Mn2+/Zn2+ transport system permease subunit
MQRALIAGVLVAIPAAVVGTFVVLRGFAFITDALAHGVIPGIAAALLLGAPGIIGAAVGAAVMVGGVDLISRRSRLSGDSAIGLMFVGMLALGVVIVSRSDSFRGDLVSILFGDILGVLWSDVWTQLAVAGITVLAAAVLTRPFLLLAFDPETARAAGFSPRWTHLAMMVLVAFVVVASFQVVGTLLVFGMLVAPPAAAALVARRVGVMMALAALIGVASVYAGLLISFHFDTAGGATIVLIQTLVFFAALVGRSIGRAPATTPGTA